jgi:hypothetical protein
LNPAPLSVVIGNEQALALLRMADAVQSFGDWRLRLTRS